MNQPIVKIDMTPLVGLALILVIIFIVTSPAFMQGMGDDLALPQAETAEARTLGNLTISLDGESHLSLNQEHVTSAAFVSNLQQRLAGHEQQLVVIRADKSVKHKQILSLLGQVKRAGAVNIALATEQVKSVHF